MADIIKTFQVPVEFRQSNMEISNFYNPGRRQYDANLILKAVNELELEVNYSRIVGLLPVDIFIPILTYIFGQAGVNGKSAIVSMFRLRNELYGLEINTPLLKERFSKVVIHELGHSFGLIHCHDPVCVMRSSTYVEDLDQKGIQFCQQCRKILNQ